MSVLVLFAVALGVRWVAQVFDVLSGAVRTFLAATWVCGLLWATARELAEWADAVGSSAIALTVLLAATLMMLACASLTAAITSRDRNRRRDAVLNVGDPFSCETAG